MTDLRIDRVLIPRARLPCGEALLAGELRAAELLAQRFPELVAMAGERDEAVARGHQPERCQEWMAVALGPRHHSGIGILLQDAFAHRQHAVDHADVDVLAGTGAVRAPDRRHDAVGGHDGRHDVADAGADLGGRRGVRPGDRHDSADRLRDHVERRPIEVRALAGMGIGEAADRGVDDSGIAVAQSLIGEPQAPHHAGAIVLDHDLRGFDQLEEDFAALRPLEVERDRRFVAIDTLEIAGEGAQPVARMERTDLARAVAFEWLDLDHLGALIREHHGAERTGQHLGEIDYAQALERATRRSHAHRSAQWLRRLISTRRSPSNTIFSSWFTPQWWKCTMPASSRSDGPAASTSVKA